MRYNETKKSCIYTQARQVLADRLWKYVGSDEHHEKRGSKTDVCHRALLPPCNSRIVHTRGQYRVSLKVMNLSQKNNNMTSFCAVLYIMSEGKGTPTVAYGSKHRGIFFFFWSSSEPNTT